jgi:LacI family transcriptional regulator
LLGNCDVGEIVHPPEPQSQIVTLKDVAERARLSPATVSYALRQHPKIPAETSELVATAARELGYRPNPRVASLIAHIRGCGHCRRNVTPTPKRAPHACRVSAPH